MYSVPVKDDELAYDIEPSCINGFWAGKTTSDDKSRKQFIIRLHGLPFWEQAFLLINQEHSNV